MSDTGTTAPATGDSADSTATDTETLGPQGEKALEAWKERAKSAEGKSKELSAAAKERDQLRTQLEDLQNRSKSEQEKQLDKAIREAEERVRKEVESSVNTRLISAEVRSRAAGVLQDPEDAVRFLDLSAFSVADDGSVDDKAIRTALDELVKTKPYLAGKAKTKGDVDQGARKEPEGNVEPGLGRLMRAYSQPST